MMLYFDIPLNIKELVTVEGSAYKDGFIAQLTFHSSDSYIFFPYATVEARSESALVVKVNKIFREWGKKYEESLLLDKQCEAENRNETAEDDQDYLANILKYHLKEDVIDVWSGLKTDTPFNKTLTDYINYEEKPSYILFDNEDSPLTFDKLSLPKKPIFLDFKKSFNPITFWLNKADIELKFKAIYKNYEYQTADIESTNRNRLKRLEELKKQYQSFVDDFELAKADFERKKNEANLAVDKQKQHYLNKDPIAIEQYCDLVLSYSELPTYITQDYLQTKWELEYKSENEMLVINYWLPNPEQIPNTKTVKYVKSRDEIVETKLTATAQKENYNNALYQICLKTIHKLFQYDEANAIYTVAFNGIVTSTNKATGLDETKVILSLLANKDEFMAINFSNVDPKQTFKHLKGVSAANLINITPVPPIIQLNKTDKRFIDGVDVVHTIDQTTNLAAMDWQDFEHLIRELLEQEFSTNGGEVKVTQGSSDGGVDAIAFDPDPIRGGKIVIQAKRYTNTVGISAVRDLYGTVMNEGATKGVLVTTSSFGSDSYNFAKNKPLTLLDGGNLLALLEKHGHKAVINIQEAKKILNNKGTPNKT